MSSTSCQSGTVPFHGHTLTVFTTSTGEHLVAMKPICEAIGLQWEAQLKRLKRHPVLSQGMSIMDTPSAGGEQETTCLPLDYLNGWLFGVDASRVKPEIRERLLQYQRECFAALAAYWQQGEAVRPGSGSSEPAEVVRLQYNRRHGRILPDDGLWFVAADVASALGLRGAPAVTQPLPTEQKATRMVGRQSLNVVRLAGVEHALLNARSELATAFRRWLDEVLQQLPAAQPSITPALPNGLTDQQQQALRALVNARLATLPEPERPAAALRCWGSLKHHFGRSYKAIEPEQFTEAVSLIASVVLEGEVLEPEPKVVGRLEINYPVSDWQAKTSRWLMDNPRSPDLRLSIDDVLSYGWSPTEALLEQLRAEGYCVDAPFAELRALQHTANHLERCNRRLQIGLKQVLADFEHHRNQVLTFAGAKAGQPLAGPGPLVR